MTSRVVTRQCGQCHQWTWAELTNGTCPTCVYWQSRSPEHWKLQELEELRRKRPRCKCRSNAHRAEKIRPDHVNELPTIIGCATCKPLLDRIHILETQLIRGHNTEEPAS